MVAFAPFSRNGEIAVFVVNGGFLVVSALHFQAAGYAPGWHAQLDGEGAFLFRLEGDGRLAVPGILGLLFDLDFHAVDLDLRFAAHKEIHPQRFFACAVDVAGQAGDEAGDVGRAAGTAVPALAVQRGAVPLVMLGFGPLLAFLVSFRIVSVELVRIEEFFTVQGHTGKSAVVHDPFHSVGVLRFSRQVEHALAEENRGDGSAGFGGDVLDRQHVIFHEAFVAERGADAAGYVHLAFADAFPEALAGRFQFLVAGLFGAVRHAGIHVESSDRVADGVLLFPDGQMRLAVFVGLGPPFLGIVASLDGFLVVVMRLLASLINEEAGHLQIAFFICGVVKLDQRQLDLLVAGVARDLALFRTKSFADQIGVAAHGIQEIAAPGGVKMRDRGFDKMPCAVELMAVP